MNVMSRAMIYAPGSKGWYEAVSIPGVAKTTVKNELGEVCIALTVNHGTNPDIAKQQFIDVCAPCLPIGMLQLLKIEVLERGADALREDCR